MRYHDLIFMLLLFYIESCISINKKSQQEVIKKEEFKKVDFLKVCQLKDKRYEKTIEALLAMTESTSCLGIANKAHSITNLDFEDESITHVKPLKYLPKLVYLNLADNQIADLQELAEAASLQVLFMEEPMKPAHCETYSSSKAFRNLCEWNKFENLEFQPIVEYETRTNNDIVIKQKDIEDLLKNYELDYQLIASNVHPNGFLGMGESDAVYLVKKIGTEEVYTVKYLYKEKDRLIDKKVMSVFDDEIEKVSDIAFNKILAGPLELMPFVHGVTLSVWIRSNRLFINSEEAIMARQRLVDFLLNMFHAGIIFDDLSSVNIMYDETREVWIPIDYGQAIPVTSYCEAYHVFKERYVEATSAHNWFKDNPPPSWIASRRRDYHAAIVQMAKQNLADFIDQLEQEHLQECKN